MARCNGQPASIRFGQEIADTLRRRVREELQLTISVGVSFNKAFAKLGSDYKKPDATTVITREEFPHAPVSLPVTDMLYVGRKTADILQKVGVHTIGALASLKRAEVSKLLGKSGELVWEYANGLDESPVRGDRPIRPGQKALATASPSGAIWRRKRYQGGRADAGGQRRRAPAQIRPLLPDRSGPDQGPRF